MKLQEINHLTFYLFFLTAPFFDFPERYKTININESLEESPCLSLRRDDEQEDTSPPNTPASWRSITVSIHEFYSLAVSPKNKKRTVSLQEKSSIQYCSPMSMRKLKIDSLPSRKTSSLSILESQQQIIRSDRIPEFHIPQLANSKREMYRQGPKTVSLQESPLKMKRNMGLRPNKSSPSLYRSDLDCGSQLVAIHYASPSSTTINKTKLEPSMSLEAETQALLDESDLFENNSLRENSKSSFISEMDEATVKTGRESIVKLKQECDDLQAKSCLFRYVYMRRALQRCINTMV